jgi:hypothetical protein
LPSPPSPPPPLNPCAKTKSSAPARWALHESQGAAKTLLALRSSLTKPLKTQHHHPRSPFPPVPERILWPSSNTQSRKTARS